MTLVSVFSRMFKKEISLEERKLFMLSSGNESIGGAGQLLKSIIIYTLSFEAIGAILLAVKFVPKAGLKVGIWEAVFHSVSSFCNAGFDIMGRYGQSSLVGYTGDVTVNLVISALIIFGGMGFIVWQDIFLCKFKSLS